MSSTVYECPECEQRILADYKQQLPPTVWCNCEGFIKMEEIS
jgi:hypothetical protein